jgi:O-antigen ligase
MKSRTGVLATLTLCGVLLVLSQTRTAFVTLLLFLMLAMVRQPRIPSLRYFRFFLGVLLFGALVVGSMPAVTDWVVREPESISDLSDRIPLWRHLLSQVFSASPWLGFGLYGYRSTALEYNRNLGTAHNAFVEILCGGGILGFTVFLLLFLLLSSLATRLIITHGRTPLVFLVIGLFLSVSCNGMTGDTMITLAPTNFLFWLLVSLLPRVAHAAR